MESKGAPRYCLMLLTTSGNKYYYDINLSTFVLMNNTSKPYKTTLHKLDAFTSSFNSKEQLIQMYNINEPVKLVYISYNFKGEKLLSPVFNNEEWKEFAVIYGNTKQTCLTSKSNINKSKKVKIDYRIFSNIEMFNQVYYELANLESGFADIILKNEKRLISLSPDTINTIIGLRAHERAIKEKKKNTFGTINGITNIDDIYCEDRFGFYCDLRKSLSSYNEFRTIYLNYCKYKTKEQKNEVKHEEVKVQKKLKEPVRPPQQLSMFD